jgi:hypothetical protein
MNELVLHHSYGNGIAFDRSGHRNHGRLTAVEPGVDPDFGSVVLSEPASRVTVAPSQTLSDLRGFGVSLRFRQRGVGGWLGWLTGAATLIEAADCFSIEVQRVSGWLRFFDRGPPRLIARVRTGAGIFTLTASVPADLNAWHEVRLSHDGISTLRLRFDDELVADQLDAYGPVGSVGPGGIALGKELGTLPVGWGPFAWIHQLLTVIGLWSYYVGEIGRTRLSRFHEDEALRELLNLGCIDRRFLAQLLLEARTDGWDAARLKNKLGDVIALGTDASIALRKADPAFAERQMRLSERAMEALRDGDRPRLEHAIGGLMEAVGALDPDQLRSFEERAVEQTNEWPFDLQIVEELYRALCLESPLRPPRKKRPKKPARPPRRSDREPVRETEEDIDPDWEHGDHDPSEERWL